jgi:hypothetical protein
VCHFRYLLNCMPLAHPAQELELELASATGMLCATSPLAASPLLVCVDEHTRLRASDSNSSAVNSYCIHNQHLDDVTKAIKAVLLPQAGCL